MKYFLVVLSLLFVSSPAPVSAGWLFGRNTTTVINNYGGPAVGDSYIEPAPVVDYSGPVYTYAPPLVSYSGPRAVYYSPNAGPVRARHRIRTKNGVTKTHSRIKDFSP